MDLLRESLGSSLGAVAIAAFIAAVVVAGVVRGRARFLSAGILTGASVVGLWISVHDAQPRLAVIELRRAAESHLDIARRAIHDGYNLDAASALDDAEARFRTINARDGLGRVELARGDLERLQGRLDQAKARFTAAAVRLNTVAHPDMAWAILRIGEMEQAAGDTDAARKSFADAAAAFARSGIASGEAEARLAFGALARRGGAYAEAVQNLKDAVRLFGRNARGQGRATLELAWISQALRHNAEGLALAAQADALFAQAGTLFGLVLTPFVGAEIAIEDEEGEVAFAAIDRAESVLDGFPDAVAAAAAYLGLASVGALRVRGGDAGANRAAFPAAQDEARALVAYARGQIDRGRVQADAVQ
ncbi:MAG: hypothetical protein EXQ93_05070 [Alphaproteobacteria bacterium]|nr:hypothetical protein [Alphaproteobacteria bacterium]